MKKYISLFLILCLLLTCFVGCSETETSTPTDAGIQTSGQKEGVEPVTQEEGIEPVTQEKTPEAEQPVAEETAATSKAENTEKASEGTTSKTKTENLYVDIVQDNPTFPSVENFEIWLLQGDEKYQEERVEMLNKTQGKNNTLVYYRPTKELDTIATLQTIETLSLHAYNGYAYKFNDSADQYLTVCAYTQSNEDLGKTYQIVKREYEEGVKWRHLLQVDGIAYYYSETSFGGATVHWHQFGILHSARVDGHFDQIEEIIPLLKLEKVTLNADAVKQ